MELCNQKFPKWPKKCGVILLDLYSKPEIERIIIRHLGGKDEVHVGGDIAWGASVVWDFEETMQSWKHCCSSGWRLYNNSMPSHLNSFKQSFQCHLQIPYCQHQYCRICTVGLPPSLIIFCLIIFRKCPHLTLTDSDVLQDSTVEAAWSMPLLLIFSFPFFNFLIVQTDDEGCLRSTSANL